MEALCRLCKKRAKAASTCQIFAARSGSPLRLPVAKDKKHNRHTAGVTAFANRAIDQ